MLWKVYKILFEQSLSIPKLQGKEDGKLEKISRGDTFKNE